MLEAYEAAHGVEADPAAFLEPPAGTPRLDFLLYKLLVFAISPFRGL